ncbi:MAG: Mut7-C RNAse domain-containing protein [Bryobacteraceae bacterium]
MKGVAWFRFYAELNDFLPQDRRGKERERHLITVQPVKDLIESFGIPHTEVDLILINGDSAAFTTPVRGGDHVSVYPVFQTLDVSSVTQVRPAPPPSLRFVLDVHLGRLAAYLRMLGFDAIYSNSASDADLAALAGQQRAILLTRDRYLLMRSEVVRGYWVRSADPKQQLIEISMRFDLVGSMQPFTRCMKCNGNLERVPRESVLDRLPLKVREKSDFRRCSACWKLYWEGTHYERMKKILHWLGSKGETPQAVQST